MNDEPLVPERWGVWQTSDANEYQVVEFRGELLIVDKGDISRFLAGVPRNAFVTVFVERFSTHYGKLFDFNAASGDGMLLTVEENGPDLGQEFILWFSVSEILGVSVDWTPTL